MRGSASHLLTDRGEPLDFFLAVGHGLVECLHLFVVVFDVQLQRRNLRLGAFVLNTLLDKLTDEDLLFLLQIVLRLDVLLTVFFQLINRLLVAVKFAPQLSYSRVDARDFVLVLLDLVDALIDLLFVVLGHVIVVALRLLRVLNLHLEAFTIMLLLRLVVSQFPDLLLYVFKLLDAPVGLFLLLEILLLHGRSGGLAGCLLVFQLAAFFFIVHPLFLE